MKIEKGLWAQMKEGKTVSFGKPITQEDWDKCMLVLEKHNERWRENIAIEAEKIENNFGFLTKRSKELGKEIPMELLAIAYLNQPVGSWFLEKYKEWL